MIHDTFKPSCRRRLSACLIIIGAYFILFCLGNIFLLGMDLPDLQTPRWVWVGVAAVAFVYAAASFIMAGSVRKGGGRKGPFWLLLANIPFVFADVMCLVVFVVSLVGEAHLPWIFALILLPYLTHALAFMMGWTYLYKIQPAAAAPVA